MKILENISSGYKKIATGIAIVTFLTILYIALIPVGSVADVVNALSGTPIIGAVVKIAEYPQYNTTTVTGGTYLLDKVPYDNITGSTYTLRFSAAGYGSNSSPVTLTQADHNPAVSMDLYPSEPMYIPFFNDGASYESDIQIFNPYSFNTTADVTTYNIIGGSVKTAAFEIPVNTTGRKSPKQVAGSDFVGAVMVENTRPQSLVQGYIKTISSGTYSIALSSKIPTETIQYLPFLNNAGGYDSGIQVFNPYTSDITVNLTTYNLLNGLNRTINYTVTAKSFSNQNVKQAAGNVDFVGSVKVETSQPALVQGALRTLLGGTTSFAPALVLSSNTVSYLPFLNNAGGYDSGIQFFNPYDYDIVANITLFNLLNGQNNTMNVTILAKNFKNQNVKQAAGNVDFVGSVKVETSQPGLVQGAIRTLGTGTTSLAAVMPQPVVTTQYIPFLNDTGTKYDSGVQVFNPYDFSITVNITGYNLRNGLNTTRNVTVNAKSFFNQNVEQLAGGDFVGAVKVETSQPALVQAAIRTLITGTGAPDGTTSIAPSLVLQ